jgi:hypothetical protein
MDPGLAGLLCGGKRIGRAICREPASPGANIALVARTQANICVSMTPHPLPSRSGT